MIKAEEIVSITEKKAIINNKALNRIAKCIAIEDIKEEINRGLFGKAILFNHYTIKELI
tara:strand:- start:218 stop:394 length:177 start_codon:yes stop_codon:yes gene_type:complete